MKSYILYYVFAAYAILFFAGNAVRAFLDAHYVIGGILLLGALVGVGMACYVHEEREEECRRKHEKIEDKRDFD